MINCMFIVYHDIGDYSIVCLYSKWIIVDNIPFGSIWALVSLETYPLLNSGPFESDYSPVSSIVAGGIPELNGSPRLMTPEAIHLFIHGRLDLAAIAFCDIWPVSKGPLGL